METVEQSSFGLAACLHSCASRAVLSWIAGIRLAYGQQVLDCYFGSADFLRFALASGSCTGLSLSGVGSLGSSSAIDCLEVQAQAGRVSWQRCPDSARRCRLKKMSAHHKPELAE